VVSKLPPKPKTLKTPAKTKNSRQNQKDSKLLPKLKTPARTQNSRQK